MGTFFLFSKKWHKGLRHNEMMFILDTIDLLTFYWSNLWKFLTTPFAKRKQDRQLKAINEAFGCLKNGLTVEQQKEFDKCIERVSWEGIVKLFAGMLAKQFGCPNNQHQITKELVKLVKYLDCCYCDNENRNTAKEINCWIEYGKWILKNALC